MVPTMAMPRPAPGLFLPAAPRRKRTQARAMSSADMPGPLSSTTSQEPSVPDQHPDRQIPALRAVTDGVVHQVADRLPQQPVGRRHLDRSGRRVHAHVQLAGTGRRQQGADDGVRRVDQVDRLGREPAFGQGGVFSARQGQHLVGGTHGPVQAFLHRQKGCTDLLGSVSRKA